MSPSARSHRTNRRARHHGRSRAAGRRRGGARHPRDPDHRPGRAARVLGDPRASPRSWSSCPGPGELGDARGQKPLKMAADLAGEPRITALSVTDNAGGHARLSPDAPGEAIRDARPRRRSSTSPAATGTATRCRAWAGTCCRASLTTVLAITGDYPAEGYEGVPAAGLRHRLGRAPRAPARARRGGGRKADGGRRARPGRPRVLPRLRRSTRSSASSATSSRSSSSSPSRRGRAPTSRSPRSATTPAGRTSSCAGCGREASACR